MNTYIVCPLCGKHIKRMKSHLRMAKEHKGLDYNKFLRDNPNIPLLSDDERFRYSKAQSKYLNTPEGKKQASDMAKSLWSDSSFKERRIREIKEQHDSEEFRELHREVARKFMLEKNKDKEFSKKASNNLKTYGKRIDHKYGDKIIRFKSKLELAIAELLEKYNIKYSYEEDLIPYIYNNEIHSYTPDFVLTDYNIMIEGKPEKLFENDVVKAKLDSAKNYYDGVYLIGYNLKPLIEIIENVTTIESIADKKSISE